MGLVDGGVEGVAEGAHFVWGVVVWCQAVVQATRCYDYRTSKFEHFAHILADPADSQPRRLFEGGREKAQAQGGVRRLAQCRRRRPVTGWPARSPCRHTLRKSCYSNSSKLARPTSNPGPAADCHTHQSSPPPTDPGYTRPESTHSQHIHHRTQSDSQRKRTPASPLVAPLCLRTCSVQSADCH